MGGNEEIVEKKENTVPYGSNAEDDGASSHRESIKEDQAFKKDGIEPDPMKNASNNRDASEPMVNTNSAMSSESSSLAGGWVAVIAGAAVFLAGLGIIMVAPHRPSAKEWV